MTSEKASQDKKEAANGGNEQAQLDALRTILYGTLEKRVCDTLRSQQRELVRDNISEALHDREQQDGTIQKVIQPMVARSVENSIASQRTEFINYLYPIVGSLVRKSVSVFISDFIEKTNELIENSFTIKGLKWRVQAWRSGIRFSDYVASQTFLFQIQQVFLIHRETGSLLHTVAANIQHHQDADLISAMLTAISDFVADSFMDGSYEQQLDVIKTEKFTLLLKSTPQIMLVAAYNGNLSPKASQKLQLTLEDIHKIYRSELKNFAGDIAQFKSTDSLLNGCLISEAKSPETQGKKFPIWGTLVFVGIIALISLYAFGWWQTSHIVDKIKQLPKSPGITITQIDTEGWKDIALSVLRDRHAQPISDWLSDIDTSFVSINQDEFISVDIQIVQQKIRQQMVQYPNVNYDASKQALIGSLQRGQRQSLLNNLQTIPGYADLQVDISQLDTIDIKVDLSQSTAVLEQTFVQLIGEISKQQLAFDSGESDIEQSQLSQIALLSARFTDIKRIAKRLNRSASLIIVGASDTSGDSAYNKRLSDIRAQNVKQALVQQGADASTLFAVGIGEISLEGNVKATRKVLFNVIFTDLAQVNNEAEF